MELGKTLIGAIIGAAIGIGIMAAAYLTMHLQGMWLAIPVALATGLGVRAMVATKGHASIVRGAVTLLLALLAYMGGWWAVAAVANSRTTNEAARPDTSAKAMPAEAAPADDATAEDPAEKSPAPKAVAARPRSVSTKGLPKAAPGNNPWDFLWLGIAALVAYELGRGTGTPTTTTTAEGMPADSTLPAGDGAPVPPQAVRPPD